MMRRWLRPTAVGLLLTTVVCLGSARAKASEGSYLGLGTAVEAPLQQAAGEAHASKPHEAVYVIGIGDMLAINVWKEPDVSRTLPVRPDGQISLPLVGEIQAAGHTPLQLEQDIATKLKAFITQPEVTVIVQQINSQKYNVLGRVLKPGSYSLSGTTTVLDAIAAAGGFQDFAKQKGIYILRAKPGGGQERIPFNYKNVVNGKRPETNILLEPHDTVVVP